VSDDDHDVDVDEFAKALSATRQIRLALNVMYDGMETLYDADDKDAQDRFTTVMQEAHDRLTAAETQALVSGGFAEHYTAVLPLCMVSPLEQQVMSEVMTAVRTLAGHGMLVQQPDALSRD
jgi:hypothetical protein